MTHDRNRGSTSTPAIAAAIIGAIASIIVALINRGCVDIGPVAKTTPNPAVQNADASEVSPAAGAATAGPWPIFFRNACSYPVRVAIQYTNQNGVAANSGWLSYDKHEERIVFGKDGEVMSASHVVYLYVENANVVLVHGAKTAVVDGRTIGMDETVLSLDNDDLVYSTCE